MKSAFKHNATQYKYKNFSIVEIHLLGKIRANSNKTQKEAVARCSRQTVFAFEDAEIPQAKKEGARACLRDREPFNFFPCRIPSNGLIDSVCCYCNFAYSNSECLSQRRSLSSGDRLGHSCLQGPASQPGEAYLSQPFFTILAAVVD